MLDYQFETTCPPEQVAAIFIEPIMSDGGLIVPPAGFLKALEERCRRHGILTVLDEVKVGLGRSGALHAFSHEGMEPDMVVLGKGLGGGLPLSALIGPAAIMDHRPAFAIQTTGGNPVCTAAGLAVLRTVLDEDLPRRAAQVGTALMEGLRQLAERHEMIGDVRGRGLAIGVDLVTDRESRAPVPATTTAKVIVRAYELGASFIYVGLAANVLEITPPLVLSDAECEEGLAIIDKALGDVAAGLVPGRGRAGLHELVENDADAHRLPPCRRLHPRRRSAGRCRRAEPAGRALRLLRPLVRRGLFHALGLRERRHRAAGHGGDRCGDRRGLQPGAPSGRHRHGGVDAGQRLSRPLHLGIGHGVPAWVAQMHLTPQSVLGSCAKRSPT